MSNVTPLPTARQPQAGQQFRPDPASSVSALVAAIDKAVGPSWSFDLIHHEVAGAETVVFTKLVVDGRYRIGIGGTTEKGSLVHRLNAATVDALACAAEWMGVAVATSATPHVPAPAQPTSDTQPSRISRKQLDYLYSLARDRRISRDDMAGRCVKQFGKKPEYLTKTEASAVIEALRKEVT
jgi:hypothetical protein